MKQSNSNGVYKSTFSSVFVRFAVCFLLLGVSYLLFSSGFVQLSPILVANDDERSFSEELESSFLSQEMASTLISQQMAQPPELSDEHSPVNLQIQNSQKEQCDLFVGNWVPDPNGPSYTNTSCATIESPQNCMKNGRPDPDYVYWRWNPKNCTLPKIDPKKFLSMMKHKSLAFIGDSIMRNHVQSLLCILSQVEEAVDVYHDKQYKNRRWSFPSYQFTVSVAWAPYLTKAVTFEDDNGASSGLTQLHLDELDTSWTQIYENFDYVVIAGGKWFLKSAIYYENNTIVGCHNCHNQNITQLGFIYSYHKALNSTLNYVIGSHHKPYIFFRTTTPDHFENGEWNSGGYCNRTRPFKEGEIELFDIDDVMRRIELEEFEKAEKMGLENGLNMELFDTTFLSLLRPDGHPGVYRQYHPYEGKEKGAKIQNDCLHWCLPGPIDSWNDIMMEMLLRKAS